MGAGLWSIRVKAANRGAALRPPRPLSADRRAARYRPRLTRSFEECAFISFSRYVVNYQMYL
jgi:hypothetical protein